MKWTPELKDELRSRWAEDPSISRIMRAMNLTRGQIEGARMRLHLHYQAKPMRTFSVDTPAVREGRTMFPGQVVRPDRAVLKPGRNDAKLGSVVTKGAWRGMPMFSLTLEERATCPRACLQWVSCMGSGMRYAKRYRHGPELEKELEHELAVRQALDPEGFVVRLHVLGDWYSVPYVRFWERMLRQFPALRVFGYTAWQPHTPIGRAVARLRDSAWDRFAVRTSGADAGPRTRVIQSDAEKRPGEIVCPAQTGKTAACSSCALCWSPAARERTVVFRQH